MNGFLITVENEVVRTTMFTNTGTVTSVEFPVFNDVRTAIDKTLDKFFTKKSEGFTGKAVCIDSVTPLFTIGKIYNIKNGVITNDNGALMPVDYEDEVVEGFNLENLAINLGCKFLEVIE